MGIKTPLFGGVCIVLSVILTFMNGPYLDS
jgi:hypothetical protein